MQLCVLPVWPNTVSLCVIEADCSHNMLVFAPSSMVTYKSFIQTGLIA